MIKNLEYCIEPSRSRFFDWKELWLYRELFYLFAWRDVKVKYKQTALGIAWVILQPFLSVLVFTLFIGQALKVPSAGLPYPVFVFSGLLFWTLFSSSVNAAGNSMVANAPIINKIYFPRIIIPVSSVLVSCLDFLISFAVFLVVMLIYDVEVTLTEMIIFWPLAITLMFAATLGLSSLMAALTVKYRDFRFIVPFALQIGLFVTPVIYPASIVSNEVIRLIASLNPLYGVIMLFRAPFGLPINNMELLISAGSGVCFLFCGLYYFRRTESYFADIA